MTAEELYRLPDVRKLERRLIEGRLVERPYEYRSPAHGGVVATLAGLFGNWEKAQARRDWFVYGYGCPYRLRREPDTFVCFDLSVIAADLEASAEADFFDGVPVFAAEVVDLQDTTEQIVELRDAALHAGVPLFWIVDPFNDLIDEFRPSGHVRAYIRGDEIDLTDVLPGFRCTANDITDE